MRITSSQPAYRFNLFHGFQHISMSTRKFPLHLKPFKNKIVDDSPLTVQIKHKTVKSEMFAFILIKPLFPEVGFEPTNHDFKSCALPLRHSLSSNPI